VNEASAPGCLDQRAAHVAADGEVHMLAVLALVPLGRPDVGQRLAPQPGTKLPEEAPYMAPKLPRVVAALAPIGECPEPVEPVRSAVAPHLRPCAPGCLDPGSLRVSLAV
jgi:hypothetical protein